MAYHLVQPDILEPEATYKNRQRGMLLEVPSCQDVAMAAVLNDSIPALVRKEFRISCTPVYGFIWSAGLCLQCPDKSYLTFGFTSQEDHPFSLVVMGWRNQTTRRFVSDKSVPLDKIPHVTHLAFQREASRVVFEYSCDGYTYHGADEMYANEAPVAWGAYGFSTNSHSIGVLFSDVTPG